MKKPLILLLLFLFIQTNLGVFQVSAYTFTQQQPVLRTYFYHYNEWWHIIEINQVLIRGDSSQNLEALRSLECLVKEIRDNLRNEYGRGPTLLNSEKGYFIGFHLDHADYEVDRRVYVEIDVLEPEKSNEKLQYFWNNIGSARLRDYREFPDSTLKIYMTTDPAFTPMKTMYTVKIYDRYGQEIPMNLISMTGIKKHNKSCQFNYAPSRRIEKALDIWAEN